MVMALRVTISLHSLGEQVQLQTERVHELSTSFIESEHNLRMHVNVIIYYYAS